MCMCAAAAAGCQSSGGSPAAALPSTVSSGPSGAAPTSSAPTSPAPASSAPTTSGTAGGTVPVKIARSSGAVLALVRVEVNGKGPFTFIADTGAARTVFYSSTVQAAGLTTGPKKAGKLSGVACSSTPATVKVSSWTLSGSSVRLPVETAVTLSPPGKSTVGGLLGSDVWSTFGSLTVDYAHSRLLVGQQPTGATRGTVAIKVIRADKEVIAAAPVTVHGQGPLTFLIDTGASRSAVASSAVSRFSLPVLARNQQVSGAECTSQQSLVSLSNWRLGSVPLPSTRALTAGGLPNGLTGLVGSDVLSRFGAVTIDYAHQRLVLR